MSLLTVLTTSNEGKTLPGEDLMPALRRRARQLALCDNSESDVVLLSNMLHLWSAFDRKWLSRLLPAPVISVETAEPEPNSELPDLDPISADGVRLRVVWTTVCDDVVERGRDLRGANQLPLGVEELMSEVYLIAARKWPKFNHKDDEPTTRWFLRILHHLIRQAIHRRYHETTKSLSGDPSIEASVSFSGTYSRIEERNLMAARVQILHGLLLVDCRASDLEERLVGPATLQLFVVAEALETVLRLSPEDCRLWAMLVVRQMESEEVAAEFRLKVGALNTRFHRIRGNAIGLLAECWAAAAGS